LAPEIITFNTLTGSTEYLFQLYATDFNVGYGVESNKLLETIELATKASLDISIENMTINNINHNSAQVEQIILSGNGLNNIDHGEINLYYYGTNIKFMVIQLTDPEITEAKLGLITAPISMLNLHTDTNYRIEFDFYQTDGSLLETSYSPTTVAKQLF